MKVFISWSGERSKIVAEQLKDWLPRVIHAIEPWLSVDMAKGTKWTNEISKSLASSRVGIFCLTDDNLNSPWLHFEAGAISRSDDTHLCTYLIGVEQADIAQPLAQWNHTLAEKADTFRLVQTINEITASSGERSVSADHLADTFEYFWPRLADAITKALKHRGGPPRKRKLEEKLDELVITVRELARAQSAYDSRGPRIYPVIQGSYRAAEHEARTLQKILHERGRADPVVRVNEHMYMVSGLEIPAAKLLGDGAAVTAERIIDKLLNRQDG